MATDEIAQAKCIPPETSPLHEPVSSWQIRVLFLHPGIFGQPLTAKLHVADLIHKDGVVSHKIQKRLRFRALSYCWGEAKFDFEISCNGHQFSITKNLHEALQRLRHPERTTHLWVDAICINQNDSKERARQVGNMMLIYSKAEEVIAWLGECPQASQYELKDLLGQSWVFHRHPDQPLSAMDKSLNVALDELAQSPWSRRVWVLQEVWAGKSISVKYGHRTAEWADLELLCRLWKRKHPLGSLLDRFLRPSRWTRFSAEQSDSRNLHLDVEEADHVSKQAETDLVVVLRRASGSICSDPRDHIYGVLGMTSTVVRSFDWGDSGTNCLIIDYRVHKTAANVFEDVARYVMHRDRALNVLFLHGKFGTAIDNDKTLPSWVPDWRFSTSSSEWIKYRLHSGFSLNVLRHEYTPLSQPSPGLLDIEGFLLGEIKSIVSDTDEDVFLSLKHLPDRIADQFEALAKPASISTTSLIKAIDIALSDHSKELVLSLKKQQAAASGGCAPRKASVSVLVDSFQPSATIKLWEDELVLQLLKRTIALPSMMGSDYLKQERGSISFAKLQLHWRSAHWLRHFANEISEDFPEIWSTVPGTQVGDLVLVVKGAFMPIVVREQLETSFLRYIGPAALSETIAGKHNETRHSWKNETYVEQVASALNEMLDGHILEQFRLS